MIDDIFIGRVLSTELLSDQVTRGLHPEQKTRDQIPLSPGCCYQVESYPCRNNWYSNGHPARRLVLLGQCEDWPARCGHSVTGLHS